MHALWIHVSGIWHFLQYNHIHIHIFKDCIFKISNVVMNIMI